MLEKNLVKEWYEKVTKIKTMERNWAIETVELGRSEIDKNLISKKEYAALNDYLIVTFYSINREIVYTFKSSLDSKKLVIGLLEEGKLKQTDYLER